MVSLCLGTRPEICPFSIGELIFDAAHCPFPSVLGKGARRIVVVEASGLWRKKRAAWRACPRIS